MMGGMDDLSVTDIQSYMGTALPSIGTITYNISWLKFFRTDTASGTGILSSRCTADRIAELRIDKAGESGTICTS